VAERPYTLLSCCISLDGYLAGPGKDRLLLSNDADFDRVDAVRAGCDAILVGAETIRSDDPRLLVRAQHRRDDRVTRGLGPSPTKVTVTAGGRLDADAQFFTLGAAEKLVYAPSEAVPCVRQRLGPVATVVDAGPAVDVGRVSEDLHARGVRRLMVEGGGSVLTQFLTADLADQLDLVVAPVFVGSSRAPRFVGDGAFPWTTKHRAPLADVRRVDDVVILRYALSARFRGD
jgi:5-amino-6-(5-phosphoribosylamino)uracil reductase